LIKNQELNIMQISVILAHPNTQSFNHAIAQAAVAELTRTGHRVHFHDLYAEKFDPVLPANEILKESPLPSDVALHCREISCSDGIIIIHPNWWGQPPAILKGWIDRVIRPGVAYQFVDGDQGEGIPVGLLKAKVALVFNTSNTSTERETKLFGDTLETLWKSCVWGLCGVAATYREMFNVVVTSTAQQRREWLEKVKEVVGQYLPRENRA
jgi:putative NADPH-quinone reductase